MAKFAHLYQIAPDKTSLMNCYIIKTAQDKIIVIDGGIDGTGKDNSVYISSAIRAILGLSQNDYFEIEAWFFSHLHRDHILECAKLLNNYENDPNFKINNFYFDFPPYKNGWETASGELDYTIDGIEAFKAAIDKYAENINKPEFTYASLNGKIINQNSVKNGLEITIDNCKFKILQTWSQNDRVVNSTSIIMRLECDGKSVLFTGDAHVDSGDRLLTKYSGESLHADYIQMSHHGQSGLNKTFYNVVNAKESIRLWPAPNWVFCVYESPNGIKSDITRSWLGLPADPAEFIEKGLHKTGKDVIFGLYDNVPEDPTKVEAWNEAVLNEQRIF